VPPLIGITGAYCVNVMAKGAEVAPPPGEIVTLVAPSGASTGISIVIWLPLFGALILNAVLSQPSPRTCTEVQPADNATSSGAERGFPRFAYDRGDHRPGGAKPTDKDTLLLVAPPMESETDSFRRLYPPARRS